MVMEIQKLSDVKYVLNVTLSKSGGERLQCTKWLSKIYDIGSDVSMGV
jgi:hypothetical protein